MYQDANLWKAEPFRPHVCELYLLASVRDVTETSDLLGSLQSVYTPRAVFARSTRCDFPDPSNLRQLSFRFTTAQISSTQFGSRSSAGMFLTERSEASALLYDQRRRRGQGTTK